MDQEIIHKVYDLIDEIKSLDVYLKMQELVLKINQDKELQEQIQQFNQIKNKYSMVKKYGDYHPDLDQVKTALSQAKKALYLNPDVKAYKECEQTIQELLNQISSKLGQAVSKYVPIPNEMGLLQKAKGDLSGR